VTAVSLSGSRYLAENTCRNFGTSREKRETPMIPPEFVQLFDGRPDARRLRCLKLARKISQNKKDRRLVESEIAPGLMSARRTDTRLARAKRGFAEAYAAEPARWEWNCRGGRTRLRRDRDEDPHGARRLDPCTRIGTGQTRTPPAIMIGRKGRGPVWKKQDDEISGRSEAGCGDHYGLKIRATFEGFGERSMRGGPRVATSASDNAADRAPVHAQNDEGTE